jgi:preprotein translocase subunit SecF
MIPFLKWRTVYFTISVALILTGMASILLWGFRYSIEFVGGSSLEYRLAKPAERDLLERSLDSAGVEVEQLAIDGDTITVRARPLPEGRDTAIRERLAQDTGGEVTVLRSETVGPTMSADTVNKTFIATGIAIIGILLYVAFAFRNVTFAVAAVVALFHDVLILVGAYSLMSRFLGAEVDTLFVTALLTTMSFSVHDTIVMFDQLRQYMKRSGTNDIEYYANKSITETIVRSLNNSMTVVFMLLALVLLGGSSITFFAVSLLVGTLIGTYSSPFVAVNLAVFLLQRKAKAQKAVKK